MSTSFYFKNIEATGAIKQYTEGKLEKVNERFHHVEGIDVRFQVERETQYCEITIHADATIFHMKKGEKDLYAAIDVTIDRLNYLIAKYRKKLDEKNHHKDITDVMQAYEVLENDDEISITVFDAPIKPMSDLEAIMQITVNRFRFMMYHHTNEERYSLVFRRPDGNYSVVAPTEETGQYQETVYKYINSKIEKISNSIYPMAKITVPEAIENIKENHQDFLGYVNDETNRMNVLFITKSGDFAIKRPAN